MWAAASASSVGPEVRGRAGNTEGIMSVKWGRAKASWKLWEQNGIYENQREPSFLSSPPPKMLCVTCRVIGILPPQSPRQDSENLKERRGRERREEAWNYLGCCPTPTRQAERQQHLAPLLTPGHCCTLTFQTSVRVLGVTPHLPNHTGEEFWEHSPGLVNKLPQKQTPESVFSPWLCALQSFVFSIF